MKGNVNDRVRNLRDKSKRAIDASERDSRAKHPASTDKRSSRKKPKATSMAPREGGKRKHYGRPFGKEGGSS